MARGLGADGLDGALARPGPAGIAELLGAPTTYTVTDPDTRVFSEMLLAATRYERLRDYRLMPLVFRPEWSDAPPRPARRHP
ncbi:hypothetical protein AWN90_22015 [Nocardia terpenica]|uniref:Uncharacterized protein n=1 Tax=Nocardia terpenica TaxID=455432 RepID=A0A164NUA1_9NOCA|nr:hypothetical protein AWN90_22015 [Nocardia terpenica]